ncbi:TM0106 family RecB-like putative nuclease [Candidatus Pelagibacter sp. HIMB1587]|uniref:TM0106 family RecB-like putative nuclease n=1 Tax=Candidatus Pelagibacter sp. HIMB1587 TaxID=3413354 RepID=UPI003F82CA5B
MNKNFYSATMLTRFINCKHIITNEFNEKKLNLKRAGRTVADNLRLEKGLIHEVQYFKELSKKYKKVKNIKILKNLSKEEKIEETIKALEDGYELIYGGWLQSGNWSGELDFLEINKNVQSNLGNYSYEIIDTKNSSKVKGDHIYQVCLYSFLLKEAQGTLADNFYILLKDKSKELIKLKEVYDTFLLHKKSYETFIKNGLGKTKPEKCSNCTFCDWKEVCDNEWINKRHLNQVLLNNRKDIKKLNNAGIYNFDELAKLNPKTKIEGLRDEIKIKRINQAKLQIEAEEKGYPIFKVIEENLILNKGFNLLPKPSECDLFFDIESVQDYVFPGRLEYLFGIYYEENGEKIFKTFWSHNKQEEKQSVIDFFNFTKAHFKKYPKAKIYHYASYEIKALERLTSLHKVQGVDYDHYLNLGRFVDLFRIVKQAIYVSEKSYSIKEVEKYYDFKRSGDIKKGDISEEYYIQWIETKKQNLLDEIEEYNKQDCVSTFKLRNWLLKIKPADTKWFIPEKEQMELRPFEENLLDYQKRFNASKLSDNPIVKLLSDVIGFYNREQKPQWRQFFDRKDLSDEELIDDRECIGNMKLVSQVQDKRSFCYKYLFPEQEYKLKKGRGVIIANNNDPDRADYAGTIQELDQINRTLVLRKGISKEQKQLPRTLSIGEKVMEQSRFENLNQNIYNFCENILENKKGYEALKNFLNRDIPNIKGIKPGEKIITSEEFDKEIPDVIARLNSSYLFLQGPPGTGKTLQSSNAIIELLKKNKRIAVTANSHKVIHNLLERVEKLAENQGFLFKGLKMGNPDNDDTYYKGNLIKTDKNEKHYIDALKERNTLLFAGTKYHLSQWYYRSKIDYLFIDEAGQISIADLIALGGVAKNIILVGDQLQLGQPTQGSHPGLSNNSVLDYLLQGKDTIEDNRGIFLNRTYRMHPNINSFVSENFYENKLLTNPENQKRKIDLPNNFFIKNEGIHTILMNHEDCTQTSEQEFKKIDEIIKKLIGKKFTDINNKVRPLSIEDFLIVSPYNAQVNFLLARLPAGTRCGTIDRFQGQQAPVTIISMTSSDLESLPRDKSFFFNRNRLNVAISRAQCLSIILFNPKLLESPPKTYEEFKMINNFQKLLKYQVNTD